MIYLSILCDADKLKGAVEKIKIITKEKGNHV